MSLRDVWNTLHDASTGSVRRSVDVSQRFGQRPVQYLSHAVWFTAIASLGEVAYLAFEKHIVHYRMPGLEYLWQIPIGYGVVFAVIGLLFFALQVTGLWRASLRTLLLICLFVVASGWIPLVVKGLTYWALMLIATGAAVQLSWILTRHAYLLQRGVRATGPLATLLVAGLAIGFHTAPYWQERSSLAELAPAAERGPNVLLMVWDTVRASNLGLYGYARPTTPNLDQFAARGVTFDHAIATASWTLPSHGGMFTATLPHRLRASWETPIDSRYPTIAEALRQHGYVTAGFVANQTYGGDGTGLGRGFIHYEDEGAAIATSLTATMFGSRLVRSAGLVERFGTHDNFGRMSAEQIRGDFLSWLSVQDRSRPYFAFLNFYDAHDPYLPPAEFARRFSKREARGFVSQTLDAPSDDEIRELTDAYDSALAYLDSEVGRLFAELDRRNELANTIVIITSDHGEHLGEHGLLRHGSSLYMPLIHVPLIVTYSPRVPAGLRVEQYVSLRNLPMTILDLASLPNDQRFPGRSLLPAGGRPPGPDNEIVYSAADRLQTLPASYPNRNGRLESIVYREMHYITNRGNGREELYDLKSDKEERRDRSPDDPARLAEYRGLLKDVVNQATAATTARRR